MDQPLQKDEVQSEKQSSFIRLIGATLGFGIVMAFTMVYADRTSIMNNWTKERCKVPIMLSSFMYKPSDYVGSSASFAQDNFDFCVKEFASRALKLAAEPAVAIAGSQIDAQGTIGQLQNSIRLMVGNVYRDFAKQVGHFYNRYKIGRGQSIRVFQYLKSAVGRLQGIIGGIVYIAISSFVSIMNTIELIVWITIAIIIILTILFIILFFKLFPFTPLIIAVVVSLVTAGLGTMIGGAAAVFCFPGDTPVIMKDGHTKHMSELVAGDELLDEGIIEGMFVFDGSKTPLYRYKGILVSGSHLVYCPRVKKYMEVASHVDAILTEEKTERVYCPIVSSRHIPILNGNGGLSLFCDWEEVSTPVAVEAWSNMVKETLNVPKDTIIADVAAGFNAKTVRVWNNEKKLVPINEIKIGTQIVDDRMELVEVLGIVKRREKWTPGISNGVWIQDRRNMWKQFFNPANDRQQSSMSEGQNEDIDIYHLITSSGTFTIMYEGIAYVVRDATEVGIDRIRSLTPTVLSELNK